MSDISRSLPGGHLIYPYPDSERFYLRTPANGPVVSRYRREAGAWKTLYEVEVERSRGRDVAEEHLHDKVESLGTSLEEARNFLRSLRWVRLNKNSDLQAWLADHNKLLEDLCNGTYRPYSVLGYEDETDPDLNPDLLRDPPEEGVPDAEG